MLFITYTRVSWHDIRLTKFHYILLGIQYIGSAAVYLVLRPLNEILAQSAMICILAPTATSAPVVAGILGGSISAVAAYSMISNLLVAFIAPLFLSVVVMPAPMFRLPSLFGIFSKSDAGACFAFCVRVAS